MPLKYLTVVYPVRYQKTVSNGVEIITSCYIRDNIKMARVLYDFIQLVHVDYFYNNMVQMIKMNTFRTISSEVHFGLIERFGETIRLLRLLPFK